MGKQLVALISLAVAGLAGTPAVGAQNVEMANPPAANLNLSLPVRGMSMTKVESSFGAPAERFAAVGQPPISRWVYPSFIVYFEYDHVVHTVATPPK